jgi:hypothetical protein
MAFHEAIGLWARDRPGRERDKEGQGKGKGEIRNNAVTAEPGIRGTDCGENANRRNSPAARLGKTLFRATLHPNHRGHTAPDLRWSGLESISANAAGQSRCLGRCVLIFAAVLSVILKVNIGVSW